MELERNIKGGRYSFRFQTARSRQTHSVKRGENACCGLPESSYGGVWFAPIFYLCAAQHTVRGRPGPSLARLAALQSIREKCCKSQHPVHLLPPSDAQHCHCVTFLQLVWTAVFTSALSWVQRCQLFASPRLTHCRVVGELNLTPSWCAVFSGQ